MEGLHRLGRRAGQRRLGPDRHPFRQRLAGEQRLARPLDHPLGRAAALALLGEDDRHFGGEVRLGQHRLAHHARKQLEAFLQRFRRGVGQVELVDRVGRRRLGIGVAAEGRAQPLPGRDRHGRAEILALAEAQVLHQVGEAALVVALVQRSGVDADADRDLARRHAVAAHGVAQAVVHFAEQPFLVARDVAAAIDPRHLVPGLQRFGDLAFQRGPGRHRYRRLRRGSGREQGQGEEEREGPDGAREMNHARLIGAGGLKG